MEPRSHGDRETRRGGSHGATETIDGSDQTCSLIPVPSPLIPDPNPVPNPDP